MNGVLLVDKPSGMTSHDVVNRIRKAAGLRKVGHTGTLDPAATGLLLICLGAATRLSKYLTGMDKEYMGTLKLGLTTDSYDSDGTILEESDVPELSEKELSGLLAPYTGTIEQIPPMVSAVKVGGKRLYTLARKGEVVERPTREVTVSRFEILEWDSPLATFVVQCTTGTYIRSLCHDIGQDIGCGAILASLRRTVVGSHHVDDAIPLDDLKNPGNVEERLLSMGSVLSMPSVTVTPQGHRMVLSGNQINPNQLTEDAPEEQGLVQIKSRSGELLALADLEHRSTGTWIQPRKVFAQATESRAND
jgi:tRNA pseudouridine55 synthase